MAIKVQAKSLVETLIAMIIISIVMSVWSMIFLNVSAKSGQINSLEAEQVYQHYLLSEQFGTLAGFKMEYNHHEWRVDVLSNLNELTDIAIVRVDGKKETLVLEITIFHD